MYMFEGADSEAYYMKKFNIPVPRPPCSRSCKAQFVCYKPVCIAWDEDFNQVSPPHHPVHVHAW